MVELDLTPLFQPESVAIVGASNYPGKWGTGIVRNLLKGDWNGEIYPVNPRESHIQGLKSYPDLGSINGPLDLVISTIPAKQVAGVVREAGAIGCKYMLVISSNFAESGKEGEVLQAELISVAGDAGVRIVGPNTMGIYSGRPDLRALMSGDLPKRGRLAVISQSGNLGVQLLSWGQQEGVGFSAFVGSGNEADLTTEDYMEHFHKDPDTDVIAIYLEGSRNGKRFFQLAKKITRDKPIVLLKGGITEAGGVAVQSHTAAMTGDNRVFEAVARQAGITLAPDTQGLIDLARIFLYQPIPKGRRVGIITLGGGWGVVTADACIQEGLKLPMFDKKTIDVMNKELPEYWSKQNPADLVGQFKRSIHKKIFTTMMEDENIDAIINLGVIMGRSVAWEIIKGSLTLPFQLIRRSPLLLPKFIWSTASGFIDSFSLRRPTVNDVTPGQKKNWFRKAAKLNGNEKNGGLFELSEYRELKDEVFGAWLVSLMRMHKKPLITITFYPDMIPGFLKKLGLLCYDTPEKGVRSLAKLCEYGEFLKTSQPTEEDAGQHDNNGIDGL